jgi:hypothetical protein
MKVQILKRCKIGGKFYDPSPEILEVWPTDARKGIITGDLKDIEGNFLAAWTAKEAYKKQIEKRKEKGTK